MGGCAGSAYCPAGQGNGLQSPGERREILLDDPPQCKPRRAFSRPGPILSAPKKTLYIRIFTPYAKMPPASRVGGQNWYSSDSAE
jgi:hypothetical protein